VTGAVTRVLVSRHRTDPTHGDDNLAGRLQAAALLPRCWADLANRVLVCRARHRAVHEGGWRLARQADGRLAASPPHRKPRAAA
jgi:hypothetical protein